MKSVTHSIFKTFLLSVLVVAQIHFAYAQTASILPPAKTTFFDANGNPLTAGTIESFIPATTTHKTTWQDAAETIPNANPLTLDAAGRALLLGSGSYRQVVKDRLGNTIWDQVTSSTGSGGGGGTIATGDGDLVGTIKPWAGMTAPNQYVFTYGQEVSRTTFSALFTAITSTQSVFCNSGSPILNGLSDTTNFWIGMSVELSCVAPGFTTVISKTATTVTLAINSNVTTNTNAVFFPWGRGNGSTTFNIPDFRGFAIAGNNNMGGTPSANLTTTFFGATGPDSSGAAGGNQSKTLLLSNLLPYTPAGIVTSTVTNNANGWAITDGTVNVTGGGASSLRVNAQGTPAISSPFAGTAQGGGGIAVSATVAAGGSGYTAGSQTLTLVGGTCTTQPQFTETTSAGAISAPVLLTPGLCSVIPSNPVATTGGGGTGGTLTVTWSAAPFSSIQPTKTSNYIIKITPDDNSATASGVTALGGMTGSIACGTNVTCTGNIISVTIPSISPPTAVTLGGVFSRTCAGSSWFNQLDTTGTFTCLQPNFTDLAGSIALGQIPNNLIDNTKIRQGIARSVIGVTGNATANVADIQSSTANQVLRSTGTTIAFSLVPTATIQKFTTGTSATYTTPATSTYAIVKYCGGGGGGSGSGTGTTGGSGGAGGNTTFNAASANGGAAATSTTAGAGGTAAGGVENWSGSTGGNVQTGVAGTFLNGGAGGSTVLFGGASNQAGIAATGAGGSGGVFNGAGNTGAGGGGGGCSTQVVAGAGATYTYTIGAAGTAGAAGTSGNVGFAGSTGYLEATEY